MNLLTDPLLRIETTDSMTRVSLPGLLAALGDNSVRSYPGMQRHQEDAFHVFLTYLGSAVLARQGRDDPTQTRDFWESGLRALAPDAEDQAWTLVVDDLSQPAFMQPPLPKPDHDKLTLKASTPDALDVLVTAKNHDVKAERASQPDIDEWVFALVGIQTMSGFLGQGNFGISRMNGGFGSRLIVEVARTTDPGPRWSDAVSRLLHHRQEVLADEYGYDERGLVLVWTEPWDGDNGLSLHTLDPCYIEICRRIRLRASSKPGSIARADAMPSKAARINGKAFKGAVGDPWTPVDLSKSDTAEGVKVLTVGPAGLTAETQRRLVFSDHLGLSRLQRPEPSWGASDLWLLVSVLVRGQGTTDGFHEMHVRLPQHIQPRLFGPPVLRDPWVALSKQLIEAAGLMQRAVSRALLTFVEGGPARLEDREAAEAWGRRWRVRYQSLWTGQYFPYLWDIEDNFKPDAALATWVRVLWDAARVTLDDAMAALPQHSSRRYRGRVRARQTLRAIASHHFPAMRGRQTEPTEESDNNGRAASPDLATTPAD